MELLLITTNPLFREVIAETLADREGVHIIAVCPEEAVAAIRQRQPDTIAVDETMSQPWLSEILTAARSLPRSHTVLLSPRGNEVAVVDVRREQMTNMEDFMRAVVHNFLPEEMGHAAEDDRSTQARVREEVYGFLAALCNRQPDLDLVERLYAIDITSILNQGDVQETARSVREGIQEIRAYVQATAGEDKVAVQQSLAVDWARLFRGLRPGYGPPPPYEGLYCKGGQEQVGIMRTLTQLYARHDAVATAAGNRPDYIGVEFDFLRYLSRRELDAWEQGDEALALHYRETACAFIAEHMVPWVGRFCELAIAEAQTDFYRGVARVTKGVINEERNDG